MPDHLSLVTPALSQQHSNCQLLTEGQSWVQGVQSAHLAATLLMQQSHSAAQLL